MNLLENPFHIIGACPRDDRRRIVDLAEERALVCDNNACAKARAVLTNPRNRVAAEVAWLPGTGPSACREILKKLESSPDKVRSVAEIVPLGVANLCASALERQTIALDVDAMLVWCLDIALAVDRIRAEDVLRLINEERAVAGFPEIQELSILEEALTERRRFYRDSIKAALNRMPTHLLVQAVTGLVRRTSRKGEKHSPVVVDELVDAYEVEAKSFLDAEEGNVEEVIRAIRRLMQTMGQGASRTTAVKASAITAAGARLEAVVRNWSSVAQPIQLSCLSRGVDHVPSSRLGMLFPSY